MSDVLFIAGGLWQKPFVQYLKDRGHRVAVVNPVETETTRIADVHLIEDVRNVEDIIELVELADKVPDFVTSDQSDISTMVVSVLSSHWGLPGNYPSVIDKFTNKYSMYEFGSDIGVSVPTSALVEDFIDVAKFGRTHGYPIIIKPIDSTMSRGFRKFESAHHVTHEFFEESLSFSRLGHVIVQKFMPGDMVTLEGVCSGGKHKTLATSRKNEYFKAGITSGVRYPSSIDSELLDKIIAENDRYVEEAGLRFGLTHSEFIINGDDFCLLEIGARGGGAGITDKIVPWVSGVESYGILEASLRGQETDVKSLIPLKRHALLKYYQKQDPVNRMDFTKEVMEIEGVAEYRHNFVGKQYAADENDTRYTMGIYLSDDRDGIDRVQEEIDGVVK